jgi:hypothetical protein
MRLADWAEQKGLSVVSAPASLQVHDARGSIVRLYPTYRSLEFAMEPLWAVGEDGAIAAILQRLQVLMPTKRLTEKSPNLPCSVASVHWAEVAAILDAIAELRSSALRIPKSRLG